MMKYQSCIPSVLATTAVTLIEHLLSANHTHEEEQIKHVGIVHTTVVRVISIDLWLCTPYGSAAINALQKQEEWGGNSM